MTTIALADWTQSPQILVGEEERRKLTIIAMTEVGHSAENSDYLLFELDRATVVPDAQLPPDVVRLGSIVRFRNHDGSERTDELVVPSEANEDEHKLSVTSEEGAALLGLRPGQTISWLSRFGGSRRLKVLRVSTPFTGSIDPDPGPNAA